MRKILTVVSACTIAFTGWSIVPAGATTVHQKTSLPSVLTAQQTYNFLRRARNAETTVFEKAYLKPITKQQINSILSPYFTEVGINGFVKKFLTQQGSKYILYPSDGAGWIDFSLTSKTKVKYSSSHNVIYASENISSDENGDYTETVTIIRTSAGWRISSDIVRFN